jgi:hypothetical protein
MIACARSLRDRAGFGPALVRDRSSERTPPGIERLPRRDPTLHSENTSRGRVSRRVYSGMKAYRI